MSSSVICTCGERIHKNLFAGAKVCIIVRDDVLDAINDAKPAGEAVASILANGDILVRCHSCGRIAIEDTKTGEIILYAPEKR